MVTGLNMLHFLYRFYFASAGGVIPVILRFKVGQTPRLCELKQPVTNTSISFVSRIAESAIRAEQLEFDRGSEHQVIRRALFFLPIFK